MPAPEVPRGRGTARTEVKVVKIVKRVGMEKCILRSIDIVAIEYRRGA